MKYLGLLLLLATVLFLGCGNDDELSACNEEMLPTLQAYIDTNMLSVTPGVDNSFSYIIMEPGDGERPAPTDNVTVNYRGYNTNDEVFDQTPGFGTADAVPLTLNLQNLIRGWQLGIPLVGSGGRVQLFIPANLAYGTRGVPGSICPNTPLIFDIELVSFSE